MSSRFFVRTLAHDLYQWSIGDDNSVQQGDIAELINTTEAQPDCEITLLVPAEQVTLKEVSFKPEERKLLQQMVPYSLEEEVCIEVDELHFALAKPVGDKVAVAIVDRQWLQACLVPFTAVHLELAAILPEQLLLPWKPGEWSLLAEGDRVLVRYDEAGGFAVERENIALALSLLVKQSEASLEHIRLYGEGAACQAFYHWLKAELEKELADRVAVEESGYWALLNGAETGDVPNLMQGEFAASLPWAKWWQYWKVAACAGGIALLLHLAYGFSHLQMLKRENLALRAQTEQAYRDVFPKGRMVDPEKQLRRKVGSLKGSSGEGFITLYARVADVLASAEGAQLQALTYSDKDTEMRLTLLAPSFEAIESIRADIEKRNLSAELTGSSNESNGTRARLRIKG